MPERTWTTSRKAARTSNGRLSRGIRVAVGGEIRRMRLDAGLSQRRLAGLAGIDHGFLSLIERGLREPSLAVLTAVATALGGSVNVRLHPGTGPRVRDPIQARIVEELVRIMDDRWIRMLEVPVYRPSRGVIDLVAHDPGAAVVVATEVQSQLRRLEQQLRWSNEKAEALPSADFWRFSDPKPRIGRLLILRSTRVNHAIVARFSATIAISYPARSADAVASLTTEAPWPGDSLVWARLDGDRATIMEQPPRAVPIGR